ncbi:uncharacterized protein METZ01_LOCUS123254, partial [marine metagenome]
LLNHLSIGERAKIRLSSDGIIITND